MASSRSTTATIKSMAGTPRSSTTDRRGGHHLRIRPTSSGKSVSLSCTGGRRPYSRKSTHEDLATGFSLIPASACDNSNARGRGRKRFGTRWLRTVAATSWQTFGEPPTPLSLVSIRRSLHKLGRHDAHARASPDCVDTESAFCHVRPFLFFRVSARQLPHYPRGLR
eukprot:scaffold4147_cov114-Isochrysis_galbana.AAC.9